MRIVDPASFLSLPATFLPKPLIGLERLDSHAMPAGGFVAFLMLLTTMSSPEQHRNFVVDLSAHRPRLGVANVMRMVGQHVRQLGSRRHLNTSSDYAGFHYSAALCRFGQEFTRAALATGARVVGIGRKASTAVMMRIMEIEGEPPDAEVARPPY